MAIIRKKIVPKVKPSPDIASLKKMGDGANSDVYTLPNNNVFKVIRHDTERIDMDEFKIQFVDEVYCQLRAHENGIAPQIHNYFYFYNDTNELHAGIEMDRVFAIEDFIYDMLVDTRFCNAFISALDTLLKTLAKMHMTHGDMYVCNMAVEMDELNLPKKLALIDFGNASFKYLDGYAELELLAVIHSLGQCEIKKLQGKVYELYAKYNFKQTLPFDNKKIASAHTKMWNKYIVTI
ncbi:hypothetical protein OAV62_01335 [bacterium]|nr:hypothetical protein [bacterium]